MKATNANSESKLMRAIAAEHNSAMWLAKGNAALERGDKAKAEQYYEKSTRWLVRANTLRGW